jgi:hypothetical protein
MINRESLTVKFDKKTILCISLRTAYEQLLYVKPTYLHKETWRDLETAINQVRFQVPKAASMKINHLLGCCAVQPGTSSPTFHTTHL